MAEFARLAAKNAENEFNDRLIMTGFARLAAKNVENESNHRLIMTTPCVTVHNYGKHGLFIS